MASNIESTCVPMDDSNEESEESDYTYNPDDDYILQEQWKIPRMEMPSRREPSEERIPLIPIQDDTGRNSETQLTTEFYKKTYTSGTISLQINNNMTEQNIHLQDVKFIKIDADKGDNDSILKTVAEGVVKQVWQLRHKNLLMSVLSGALELDNEVRGAIQNAIEGVLEGTCVVTDGTYKGGSRLVEQAVIEFNINKKKHPIGCPLIGIVYLDDILNKTTIKEPWEVKKGVFGIDSDGELFIVDNRKQR
ncbi:hypothetical protein DPMN_183525 [Dreissena polymorpha]|uniref:Uncharacterized protein n=2 Tax=Dreissena polymorpha TaxID=45954 RepID=A0A9D4I5J2_DREPO|nr:hypothetical protein DPMN_183525 [Dreissena polymorpha]